MSQQPPPRPFESNTNNLHHEIRAGKKEASRHPGISVWVYVGTWFLIVSEFLSFFNGIFLGAGFSITIFTLLALLVVAMYSPNKSWTVPLIALLAVDDIEETFNTVFYDPFTVPQLVMYLIIEGFLIVAWWNISRST